MLPDLHRARLETWSIEPASSAITLALRARRIAAHCPLCGRQSKRVHSCYERILADLHWGEYGVVIRFKVRRLFCDAARCARRIFAEGLPGVAAPAARKATRLAGHLTSISLALGGAAGARFGRRLGLAASRNTLLRLVRRAPLPAVVTPSALGVDDWALRKRDTYGTVLVDLDRRRPSRKRFAFRRGGAAARPRGGNACNLAARAPGRRGGRARDLGIGRTTVFRHLRTEAFPERKNRRDGGRSRVDPWRHVALGHWNAGRRHGRWLFRTLQQQHGYRGSHATLARYLRRLRTAEGTLPARTLPSVRPRSVHMPAPRRVLTPRTAAWLALRRYAPALDEAVALAEAFTGLVRDRSPDCLDPWLQQAESSAVRQLRGFAKRLWAGDAATPHGRNGSPTLSRDGAPVAGLGPA